MKSPFHWVTTPKPLTAEQQAMKDVQEKVEHYLPPPKAPGGLMLSHSIYPVWTEPKLTTRKVTY